MLRNQILFLMTKLSWFALMSIPLFQRILDWMIDTTFRLQGRGHD